MVYHFAACIEFDRRHLLPVDCFHIIIHIINGGAYLFPVCPVCGNFKFCRCKSVYALAYAFRIYGITNLQIVQRDFMLHIHTDIVGSVCPSVRIKFGRHISVNSILDIVVFICPQVCTCRQPAGVKPGRRVKVTDCNCKLRSPFVDGPDIGCKHRNRRFQRAVFRRRFCSGSFALLYFGFCGFP